LNRFLVAALLWSARVCARLRH